MRWRIYRLPGDRDWWRVDHGPRTLVIGVKSFRTDGCFARSEAAPDPAMVPRAWIGISASELYVSDHAAVFKGLN